MLPSAERQPRLITRTSPVMPGTSATMAPKTGTQPNMTLSMPRANGSVGPTFADSSVQYILLYARVGPPDAPPFVLSEDTSPRSGWLLKGAHPAALQRDISDQ